jgi:hypothetical protein
MAGAAAGPDAELFDLIAAAREAKARYDASTAAAEEAWDRTENVPAPQSLIVTEDDTQLWKLKAGEPFKEDHLKLMRERQAHRQNAKFLEPFSVIGADAPHPGGVVFRFEVRPLRKHIRNQASADHFLRVATIAGANFAVAQVTPRTTKYDHLHHSHQGLSI